MNNQTDPTQRRAELERKVSEARERTEKELAQAHAELIAFEEKQRMANASAAEQAEAARLEGLRRDLAAANKQADHDAHRKRVADAFADFQTAAQLLTASVRALHASFDVQHEGALRARAVAQELGVTPTVPPLAAEELIARMERYLAGEIGKWVTNPNGSRLVIRPEAVRTPRMWA